MKKQMILINIAIPSIILIILAVVHLESKPENPLPSPSTYPNNSLLSEKQIDSDNVITDNLLSDNTDTLCNSVEREPFEDSIETGPSIGTHQPPISSQDVQEDTQSVQSTSKPYMPGQNTPGNSDVQNASIPDQNPSDNGISGSSGNADNFDIYYHPELQKTTDKFVLNTDSHIFHLPTCNDVAKMAYENYATSNDSYEELSNQQHYKPCGHCLNSYVSSGNQPANTVEPNVYDNVPSQPPAHQDSDSYTYIIDTSTGYFHLPNGCKYINKYSKPEDCIPTNSSQEELRAQGYRSCRFCFD